MAFIRVIICFAACLLLGGPIVSIAHTEELARVDDMVVTVDDFEHMISILPQYYLQRPGSDTVDKKKLLDKLLNEELIAREAKKLDLEKRDDYRKRLESVLRELLVSVYIKKLYEDKNTEENQRAFYEANIDWYTSPAKVRLRVITLQKSEEDSKEIFKMAKGGKDFAELARTYSASPTAKKGGDMGWRPKRRLSKALAKVVFSMKKGEIRGPIKDRGGYQIVKLLDRQEAQAIPFKQIKTKIYNDYALTLRDDEIARLRKAAEIHVNNETLSRIRVH